VDGLPADASNPSWDNTTTVHAFHMNSVCHEEVSPGWRESHRQFNRQDPSSSVGLNNGFVYSAANYSRNTGGADVEGLRSMGYYEASQLNYYYFMATQFATSDRFFSSILTNTPANRLYSFAATSAGFTRLPTHSLNVPTIWSRLEEKGISWKIYSDKPGSTTLSFFQPFANQHMDHIFPYSQYFTDAKNGTLPSVAFIQNQTSKDEHPTANIQSGAKFASTFINALMQSPNWKDSVFFLGYDEAGGIYDHVPPPNAAAPDNIQPTDNAPDGPFVGFDRYGFRIPFLAVSPFTKPGFVSHTVADNTAILKFIETRFGLSNLTARDAAQPDLQEFFDYQGVPNANPPSPPQQNTDGPCYYDHVP
jgi:phospholipase C